jgi:hypothetical protein
MANISIDDVVYENLIHNLDVLDSILSQLKNDDNINILRKVVDDYTELENIFSKNKQLLLDIEILNINGTLEISRMKDNKNISNIFTKLQNNILSLRDNMQTSLMSFNDKKTNINRFETNIDRLEENIDFITNLKNELKNNTN